MHESISRESKRAGLSGWLLLPGVAVALAWSALTPGFAADAPPAAGPAVVPAAAGEVTLEGTVARVSRIPDPRRNPYPDCQYTVRLDPPPGAPGNGAMLVLPAFRKRALVPEAGLRTGERIRVTASLYEDMSEEYRGIQIADDIADLDLPVYAGLRLERIQTFSAVQAAPAAVAQRPSEPVVPAESSPEERQARAAQMAADLSRIDGLLARHGTWEAWYDELAPIRADLRERLAKAPGGYLRNGTCVFKHLDESIGERFPDDDVYYRSVLDALENMKTQFEQVGTDLIVAMIPMRDHVYASRIVSKMPADGVLQPYWLKFHRDLLQRGVETIDMLPRFEAAVDTRPLVFLYNVPDAHPGRDGVMLAAEAIAERLARYRFTAPRRTYTVHPAEYRYPSSAARFFPDPGNFGCDQVLDEQGGYPAEDPRSEVIMVGDSMLTAPQCSVQSCSLGVNTMRLAGFPFTFVKQAGSAPMMSELLAMKSNPAFFSRRRVCVFVLAEAYLPSRTKPWSMAAFVDRSLSRARKEAGESKPSLPAFATLSGTNLPRMAVQPPPARADRGSPLTLETCAQPRRLVVPAVFRDAGVPLAIGVSVIASASSVWQVVTGGKPAGEVRVAPGCSFVEFRLPAGTSDWSGLLVPAQAPQAIVSRVTARWADMADGGLLSTRGRHRMIARYDSNRDFAKLPVVPAGRVETPPALVLDPSPEVRTIELPGRPIAGWAPARWLIVDGTASAPVKFEVDDGTNVVGAVTMPDLASQLVFAVPPSDRIRVRIPANAPGVRIHRIELQAPVP